MKKIGFIGAGNMGSALIKAIYNSKITKNIIVSDPNREKLAKLKREYAIQITTRNADVVRYADIIFLTVKPFSMQAVLDEIKSYAKKQQLFVSIAAGVRLNSIQAKLKNCKVIRVMSNTPCFVGEMAAGFSLGRYATRADSKLIKRILDLAGLSFEVKENLLDAITGLSGSGPAFVAYLIRAFARAGKKSGIPEDIAIKLSRQTFLGTAKLLKETKLTEDELIEMVTTKGGTTEAGRKSLEASDVEDIIMKTVVQATKRSRELGK